MQILSKERNKIRNQTIIKSIYDVRKLFTQSRKIFKYLSAFTHTLAHTRIHIDILYV